MTRRLSRKRFAFRRTGIPDLRGHGGAGARPGPADRGRDQIEISSEKSLYDRAAAVVQAFDFDLDHTFGFFSKLDHHAFDSPMRYELFADLEGGSESGSVKRTEVAQAFPALGAKLRFLFDYGDDWRFQVEVIGLGEKAPTTRYPKLLKAAGKAPPQYLPEDENEE